MRLVMTLFALLALLAGCTAFEEPALSRDHPAHPEAQESPIPTRSGTLDLPGDDSVEPAEPMEHDHGHHHHEHHSEPAAPPVYVCPMHEEVRSDRPGKCPKCGMELVREDSEGER